MLHKKSFSIILTAALLSLTACNNDTAPDTLVDIVLTYNTASETVVQSEPAEPPVSTQIETTKPEPVYDLKKYQ